MSVLQVVVVGGGVSGLSAAYEVIKRARAKGRAVACTVLEARDRVGGNIVTERRDGWVLDGGPDSWVAMKPHATALCRELGLGDQIVPTLEGYRKVYVAQGGRLHPLPEGVVMTVPTRIWPLVKSPLISWSGKLRMGLDLVLPRGDLSVDESLGDFVARRLGREAVDKLAEPIMAGIYAGSAWQLSMRAAFPQFVEMERKDRSLIRAVLASRARAPAPPPGAKPPSIFQSLAGGLGTLIEALAAALPEGTVRTHTAARALERLPDGDPRGRYAVVTDKGDVLHADGVVLATPAHASAKLMEGAAPDVARALGAIGYTSAATVFFGYRREDIGHPLDATGFITPRTERLNVLASTWITSKWPGRAPERHVLLRAFLGGVGREAVLRRPDDELAALALDDLRAVMGFTADPLFTRVFRFDRSSPQPGVGHLDRLAAIREGLAALPGVHVVGSAYEGIGIPDCVRQAGEAAEELLA